MYIGVNVQGNTYPKDNKGEGFVGGSLECVHCSHPTKYPHHMCPRCLARFARGIRYMETSVKTKAVVMGS